MNNGKMGEQEQERRHTHTFHIPNAIATSRLQKECGVNGMVGIPSEYLHNPNTETRRRTEWNIMEEKMEVVKRAGYYMI